MIRSALLASISRWNGSSSRRVHVFVTSATPKSVFVVELPIPGKCLRVVRTPAARCASISALAIFTTTSGSAENDRSSAPIAGLDPDEPFPVTNTTKEFREMIGAPPLSP